MVDSTELETAAEVMDALGGNAAVADLTGSRATAVSNWRSFGKFPAKFYVLMTDELRRRGLRAPALLWGMTEPPAHSAVSAEARR